MLRTEKATMTVKKKELMRTVPITNEEWKDIVDRSESGEVKWVKAGVNTSTYIGRWGKKTLFFEFYIGIMLVKMFNSSLKLLGATAACSPDDRNWSLLIRLFEVVRSK